MKLDTELILDIGQTNIKLYYINSKNFNVIKSFNIKNNFIEKKKKYFFFNHNKLKNRIFKILIDNSKLYNVNNISCVSFGSTAFYIDKNLKILPAPTFNNISNNKIDNIYNKNLPKFSNSLTPKMEKFHNMGKQILLMNEIYKKEKIAGLINLPNLINFYLNNNKGFDLNYLACHSHLFNFKTKKLSSLCDYLDISKYLNNLNKPFEISENKITSSNISHFLNKSVKVRFGCHDTNSSYFFHKNMFKQKIDVVCTGTWFVLMSESYPVSKIQNNNNSFGNYSLNNKILPSFRFPGGIEYMNILNNINNSKLSLDIKIDYLKLEKILKDYFNQIKIYKKINYNKYDLKTLKIITLFKIAVYTSRYLTKLNSKSSLIIDGFFAKNNLFLYFLTMLRKRQKIYSYIGPNSCVDGFLFYINKNKIKDRYIMHKYNDYSEIDIIFKLQKMINNKF